jgi:hypothetical protein
MKSRWMENDDALIHTLKKKGAECRTYLVEVVNGSTTGPSTGLVTESFGSRFEMTASGDIKETKAYTSGTTARISAAFDSRTKRENSMIRWVQQRKYGRNPWFILARELRPIRRELERWAQVDRDTSLKKKADRVGEVLVRIFQAHIRKRKSKGGKQMPPNTKRYKMQKSQATGRNLPPLILSGQLMKSIINRVSEV